MRKVKLPKLEFEYDNSEDNEEIVQRMYNKIFDLAKQKVLNKKKFEKKRVIQNRTTLILNDEYQYNTNDQY